MIACINNGEEQEQEQEQEQESSAHEDEPQASLDGQWPETATGDLSSLDQFMASGWGAD